MDVTWHWLEGPVCRFASYCTLCRGRTDCYMARYVVVAKFCWAVLEVCLVSFFFVKFVALWYKKLNWCTTFCAQSRSPSMVPFHMLGMVSCWFARVTLSIRSAVFEIFNFRKCRNLEIRVKGYPRSFEPTRIDPPPMTSYITFFNLPRPATAAATATATTATA